MCISTYFFRLMTTWSHHR